MRNECKKSHKIKKKNSTWDAFKFYESFAPKQTFGKVEFSYHLCIIAFFKSWQSRQQSQEVLFIGQFGKNFIYEILQKFWCRTNLNILRAHEHLDIEIAEQMSKVYEIARKQQQCHSYVKTPLQKKNFDKTLQNIFQ